MSSLLLIQWRPVRAPEAALRAALAFSLDVPPLIPHAPVADWHLFRFHRKLEGGWRVWEWLNAEPQDFNAPPPQAETNIDTRWRPWPPLWWSVRWRAQGFGPEDYNVPPPPRIYEEHTTWQPWARWPRPWYAKQWRQQGFEPEDVNVPPPPLPFQEHSTWTPWNAVLLRQRLRAVHAFRALLLEPEDFSIPCPPLPESIHELVAALVGPYAVYGNYLGWEICGVDCPWTLTGWTWEAIMRREWGRAFK